jgi:hypothetical protein
VNPEEEAIEILTSENVSLGGPARLHISLKPHQDTGGDPQQQQQQPLLSNNNNSTRFLTLTGTVKRGRHKGFDSSLRAGYP